MRRGLILGLLAIAAACTTVEEGDGGVGTSSGGTTTGGTVGTPDNTTCLAGGPGNGGTAIADELTPCSLNRDCICPLECLDDSPRLAVLGPSGTNSKFCERSCATNADCPLQSEVCVPRGDAGTCLEIPCGPVLADGGLLNGDLGEACSALSGEDGTCIPNAIPFTADPEYDGGGTLPIVANGMPNACWLGGTSNSACTLTALASDPSDRCPPAEGCALLTIDGTSSNGICTASCDPTGSGYCAAGTKCELTPILDPTPGDLGFCYAAGSGGCLSGLPTTQTELFICNNSADCACPEACTQTPSGSAKWCARSCSGSADCPNPSTGCVGGVCAYLPCGAMPLGACDYVGSGDGTCLAPGFSWAAGSPYCVAAGSLAKGAGCSLISPQSVDLVVTTSSAYLPTEGVTFPVPNSYCAPGLLCVDTGSGNETGTCRLSCNDEVTPGVCGSGTCYVVDPSGFGFCHGG
jgi:hypothetical protein